MLWHAVSLAVIKSFSKTARTVCLGMPIAPLLLGLWEAQQRMQNLTSYLFQPGNNLLVAFELALWL